MADLPKVTVDYSDGNLLQDVVVLDGIVGLCGSGNTPSMLGVPKTVQNLADAVEQGFTEADEPVAYRHIAEFYGELGGNQELHVMLVPKTMTMTQMLTTTNDNGANKLLIDAEGKIRLLAVFRSPDTGYNPGSDFIDSDVGTAILASKVFCEARLAVLDPIRVIIEGRVVNEEVLATANYLYTTPGTVGNTTTLKVTELDGTVVTLGLYTVIGGDVNNNDATGMRAAINLLTATHGYKASGAGANVIVTCRKGTGIDGNSFVLSALNTGTVAGTITQFTGGSSTVANTLTPKTSSNGFAGVCLGGTLPDGSASVGVLLGRAAKYRAHIKVGKVANGPLSISSAYIGSKPIKKVLNLGTLHGAGFISFMKQPQKAGFYFGLDRMASVTDYRLLVYGRVVDKAALIAIAVYVEELESEVETNDDGTIDSLALSGMENRIEQQVLLVMGASISGFKAYINPNQLLIGTDSLSLKLRVQPKGYKSFINIDLGLTAQL